MPFRAITISGEVATGKSSVARALLARLPEWEYLNTGQKFRDFCAAQGWSIQQVAALSDAVHRQFDADQLEMLRNKPRVIVEGRLAGWLARDLPDVFRVFCIAPLETRITRYMERDGASRQKAAEDIEYRDAGDVEKYRQVYGIEDYRAPVFYHLVLDTDKASPAELAGEIIQKAGLE